MLVGALLKVLHFTGASLLLFISILGFSTFFLPLALIYNYKKQEEKKYKWLHIVTYLVFSITFIGALFKILHWPYANILMIIGIPLPFVLFLPVYLYNTWKDKSVPLLNHLGVMFGLTFLALFSVLLSLNISYDIAQNFAINSYNSDKATTFYQAISKSAQSSDKVKQKGDELCKYIDEIKCKLLANTNNGNCDNGKLKDNFNPLNLSNPTNQTSILIEGGALSDASKLVDKIQEFKLLLENSNIKNQELIELTHSLLNIDDKYIGDKKDLYIVWYKKEFPTNNITVLLDVLSRIQCNVRFIEAEYLASI